MPRPLGLRLRAAVRRFWFLTQRRLMRFAAGGSTSPSVLRRHAPALEPRSSTLWASSAGGGGHTRAPSGSSGAAVGPLSASLEARCASYEPRLASRVASAPAHLRRRTSSCQCIPFACARTGRFAASGGGVSLCADLDADGRGVRGGWLAPELAPGPALGLVVIGGVEGRRFRSDFSSDFRSCSLQKQRVGSHVHVIQWRKTHHALVVATHAAVAHRHCVHSSAREGSGLG